MTETKFPYHKKDFQPESTNWQLSPSISFLILDSGRSSLHFHWDRHNALHAAVGGKIVLNDIKSSIEEIAHAIESIKKLITDKKVLPPKFLGTNTPNLLFRKLFPSEYMVERYGKTILEINIESYMEQTGLNDRREAWMHFIEHQIAPRLASIQQRLTLLTKGDETAK